MQTIGSRFRNLARIGVLAAVMVTPAYLAAAEPPSNRGALMSARFINSLLDDAMGDGMLDRSERELILGQAERILSRWEVEDLTRRLNTLPTPSAVSTAPRVQLGAPVPSEPDMPRKATIRTTSLEMPAQTDSRYAAASRVRAIPEEIGRGKAECSDDRCAEVCSTRLLDNLYLFSAVDAWRGPLDGDQSNNFGARIGFNAGTPLLREREIGAQFGMSYGVYDFHGRFDLSTETETSSIEEQLFITTGFFKHCNLSNECATDRISWGVVYDRMITDNTSAATAELSVGQFRGQIGYACDECTEVGLWGSITDSSDDSFDALAVRHVTRSIDQLNLYCRRIWCTGADTRVYVGIAEEPGEFVFGANGQLPLNDCWAVFSGFHYIFPSTSGGPPGFRDEIWNVTAGIAYYPGGNAIRKTVCGPCWQPLLPVADNGTFALDLGF